MSETLREGVERLRAARVAHKWPRETGDGLDYSRCTCGSIPPYSPGGYDSAQWLADHHDEALVRALLAATAPTPECEPPPECTCAMTESSQIHCERHGLDSVCPDCNEPWIDHRATAPTPDEVGQAELTALLLEQAQAGDDAVAAYVRGATYARLQEQRARILRRDDEAHRWRILLDLLKPHDNGASKAPLRAHTSASNPASASTGASTPEG